MDAIDIDATIRRKRRRPHSAVVADAADSSRCMYRHYYALAVFFITVAALVQLPTLSLGEALQQSDRGDTNNQHLKQLDHTLSLSASAGVGSAPDVVLKRAVSDKSRMVFVAGVEGTGHHAFRAFFDVCVLHKENTEAKEPACAMEVELSKQLMTYNEQDKRISGIFGSALAHKKDHAAFNTLSKSVHHRLHQIAKIKDRQHLSVAGLAYGNWVDAESGMLSYVSVYVDVCALGVPLCLHLSFSPSLTLFLFLHLHLHLHLQPNYDGVSKTLDTPDLVQLAAMAESAKLDLRVLVLYRTDVRSLLRSYTKRFEMNYWEEALVMINSLAVLYSQLQLIDRKFVHCVHFEAFTGRGGGSAHSGNSTEQKTQPEQMSPPDNIPPYTDTDKAALLHFIHGDVLGAHSAAMWAVIKPKGVAASNSGAGSEAEGGAGEDESNGSGFHGNYLLWRLRRQMSLIQSYCLQGVGV